MCVCVCVRVRLVLYTIVLIPRFIKHNKTNELKHTILVVGILTMSAIVYKL